MDDLILYGWKWRTRIIMVSQICECYYNSANENQLDDTSILAQCIRSLHTLLIPFILNKNWYLKTNTQCKEKKYSLKIFQFLENFFVKFSKIQVRLFLFSHSNPRNNIIFIENQKEYHPSHIEKYKTVENSHFFKILFKLKISKKLSDIFWLHGIYHGNTCAYF